MFGQDSAHDGFLSTSKIMMDCEWLDYNWFKGWFVTDQGFHSQLKLQGYNLNGLIGQRFHIYS